MEGGDLQVATWIKDEGFDTTIPSVMQVLHSTPLQDLCMGKFCLSLRQGSLKPAFDYRSPCPFHPYEQQAAPLSSASRPPCQPWQDA